MKYEKRMRENAKKRKKMDRLSYRENREIRVKEIR